MASKKVMVFRDPHNDNKLTYQYCERASRPDDLLKEEFKTIFNDIQLVIQEHGWMKATGIAIDLGKKQFPDSWHRCEWSPARQKNLMTSTEAEQAERTAAQST